MTNDLFQCGNCIYHYTYNGQNMCKQVGDDFYLQWKVENCPYHTTIKSAMAIIDEIYRLRAENAALHERLEKSVKLPCKIGDKLYRFDGTKIIEYQVSMITLLSNGDCKIRLSYQLPAYNSRTTYEIRACDIGNKYFPTQAEACVERGG